MQFSSEFYVHEIFHAGKDKNITHSFDLGVGKVKSTKKTVEDGTGKSSNSLFVKKKSKNMRY